MDLTELGSEKKLMTTNGKMVTAGAGLILVLGGVGAAWVGLGHTARPPAVLPSPVAVRVVKPEAGGVERTVTRPGSVHSFAYANLFAKVSGFLQDQKVDIGDRVEKGQLLAEIYAPEIQANVQKVQADLQKSQAQVEVMQARIREAKANLDESVANVAQKRADLESAKALVSLRKQQYTRFYKLARANALQQELVDEKFESKRVAEAAESAAGKAVVTAEAAITAAKAHIERTQADLADAKAQVGVAEASLSRARTFDSYTRITSPYTGVITRRSFHDGDFVRDAATGGATPILSVARTDLMRVVTWVPDRYVPFTRKGDRAVVRVDALPGHPLDGVVARTGQSEDFNTRTMRTEVDLPNRDGRLTEGMYGNVTLYLGKTRDGLAIPTTCLQGASKGGKRSVYVVQDGKAREIAVRVGMDDGIRAEILSGLQPDATIVERHGPGLADGVPVQVVQQLPDVSAQKSYQAFDKDEE